MSRNRSGVMSEKMKYELARELGIADKVHGNYWGDVTSRDCGNLVRKAIEIAERNMAADGSLTK